MMQSKDKRAAANLKKHRDPLGLDDGDEVELKVFADDLQSKEDLEPQS